MLHKYCISVTVLNELEVNYQYCDCQSVTLHKGELIARTSAQAQLSVSACSQSKIK